MKNITVWVKTHPYLSAVFAFVLVVVFYLVYSRGSVSSAPAQSSGPTGPSDAVQQANIAAQSQAAGLQAQANAQQSQLNAALAAKKIDADTALAVVAAQKDALLGQATIQGQALMDQNATNFKIAGVTSAAQQFIAGKQSDAAVSIATLQASVASQAAALQAGVAMASVQAGVTIAGIQAGVINNQTAAGLALGLDANKTAIILAGPNSLAWHANDNATNVSLANIAAGLQLGLDTNLTNLSINQQNGLTQTTLANIGLTGLTNTNYTNLQIANLAAGVANHQIDSNTTIAGYQAGVQNNFINAGLSLGLGALANQSQLQTNNFLLAQQQQNYNWGVAQAVIPGIVSHPNTSFAVEQTALLTNLPSVAIASIQGSAASDPLANFTKNLGASLGAIATSFAFA